MNRRSFLTSLGLIIAAASAPGLLLPRASDHARWKKSASQVLYVPNPEYVSAPYEMTFLWDVNTAMLFEREGCILSSDARWPDKYPPRFDDVEMKRPVAPFIEMRA